MRKNLLPYLAAFVVLLALDALGLGWVATDWYDTATGHLAAEVPSLGAATAFYLIVPVGVMVFVLRLVGLCRADRHNLGQCRHCGCSDCCQSAR